MGNDASKQRLQPNPRGVAHRRLSTDSARRHRASLPAPGAPVQFSASCSEGFLSPSTASASSSTSRLSIDATDRPVLFQRSRSGSACSDRSNSIRRKNPMLAKNRQLIQSCFQNPHEIVGRKIVKRSAEKRSDVAAFYGQLSPDQKEELENGVKMLLKKTVASIDSVEEVERLAEEFGLRLVPLRSAGFKADYFATIADATITECTFLDNAVHPAHQTLQAFSQFVGIVFSAVRNGFYTEMRRQRRSSHSFSTGQAGERRAKLSIPSAGPTAPLINDFYSPTLLVNGSDPFLGPPHNAFY